MKTRPCQQAHCFTETLIPSPTHSAAWVQHPKGMCTRWVCSTFAAVAWAVALRSHVMPSQAIPAIQWDSEPPPHSYGKQGFFILHIS